MPAAPSARRRRTTRPAAALAGLAGLVLALGPGLAAAPAAAADVAYPVPDTATIHLEGDGSGHGIGMSQYGAYSAARAGRTWREIVDFYYPGTGRGEAAGKVAVLVTADDDHDLVVDARRGLTLRPLAGGRTVRLSEPGASRWRVTALSRGRSEVAYRTRTWHRLKVVDGGVELAADGAPLTLRTPDGATRYRGALRSARDDEGRVTVNVLPMEQYLRGVVPSEVAASSWPQHAIRAQAVAARTYAAYERAHTSGPYDLCDTPLCQVYGGASAEYPTSDTAVARTAGRVLTWDGDPAFAQYSASNGGWTVAGPFPYLPAQEDPFEGHSADYYGWERTLTAAQVEARYNLENLVEIQVVARDGHGGRGGRVAEEGVYLESSTGFSDTVDGEKFRSAFGLPTAMFEITAVD